MKCPFGRTGRGRRSEFCDVVALIFQLVGLRGEGEEYPFSVPGNYVHFNLVRCEKGDLFKLFPTVNSDFRSEEDLRKRMRYHQVVNEPFLVLVLVHKRPRAI